MVLPLSADLSVGRKDNSESCLRIWMKFLECDV